MKRIFFLLTVLVFIIISSQNVYSAGLAHRGQQIYDFTPNLEGSMWFRIIGVKSGTHAVLSLEGDLNEYVTLGEVVNNEFTVKFKLPEEIPGGKHTIYITVAEKIDDTSGGGVTSLTAASVPIHIIAPYKGLYADVGFDIPNVNEGEDIEIRLVILSKGDENFTASGTLDILKGDEKIETFQLEQRSVKKQNSTEYVFTLKSSDKLKPGEYKGVVSLEYTSLKTGVKKTIKRETSFRIGTLFVNLVSFTNELFLGGIQKFDILIESKWNTKIEDIFAEIEISKNGELREKLKTINTNLGPFQPSMLSAFLDTSKLGFGGYDVNVTLFYEGKTSNKIGKLDIVKLQAAPTGLDQNILTLAALIAVIIAGLMLVKINKGKLKRKKRKSKLI